VSADPGRPSPGKKKPRAADTSVLQLQLPPHSIDAEQSVLGALLIDSGAFDKVADVIAEGHFYREDHRCIFRHVSRLIETGQPVDPLIVAESIKASEDRDRIQDPFGLLAGLAANTPSAHNVRRYAEIVRECAQLRKFAEFGAELQDLARGHGADPAEVRHALEAKLEEIQLPYRRQPRLNLERARIGDVFTNPPPAPGFLIGSYLPFTWGSKRPPADSGRRPGTSLSTPTS